MSDKEKEFNLKDIKDKMNKAFEEYDKYEELINFFDENIDLINQKITPMYETSLKIKDVVEKILFIKFAFSQASMLAPFFKKMGKMNGEDTTDFTI